MNASPTGEPPEPLTDRAPATPPPPPSAPPAAPPRVVPRPQPRRFRQWPILLVLCCLLVSLLVVAANHFRRGTYLLSGSVLLAAVLRLALPTREAGVLAVRSRFWDVLVLFGLGGGMLALAYLVPKPS